MLKEVFDQIGDEVTRVNIQQAAALFVGSGILDQVHDIVRDRVYSMTISLANGSLSEDSHRHLVSQALAIEAVIAEIRAISESQI